MSTSNSIDFTVTCNDIITEALELLGVLGEGESPTSDQFTSSKRTLNMMAKNWQAAGLNLFAVQKTYLFPEKTVADYSLYRPAITTETITTTSLRNLATDYGVGVNDIPVTLTSGSGTNRKVLLALSGNQGSFGDFPGPDIGGSFMDLVSISVVEGYLVAIYEMLDSVLPDTSGTYTITGTQTLEEIGRTVLYAEGFTQISSSSSDQDFGDVGSLSTTVSPSTSNYLVFSSCALTFNTNLISRGSTQVSAMPPVIYQPAITGGSFSICTDYSINETPTHTFSYADTPDTEDSAVAASFEIEGLTIQSTDFTRYVTDYYELTTDSDALSGSVDISVADDTSLTMFEDSDVVGIHLSDNTIQWTNATLSGTTLTLSEGLSQDVSAGSGIYGYTFSTDAANRPMLILEAYNKQYNSSEIPVELVSRVGYNDLSVKNTVGYVNQVYYDPQIDRGRVSVWPTVNDEKSVMIFLTQRTLEDFDSSSNSPDFPQEWYMPLAVNLAKHLAPKYGTPQMDYSRILQQARELYVTARDFDTELGTSMYLMPNTSGMGY